MSSSPPKTAFPKILVAASFPPDVPGGSPWLLYQLLRGIPPERVAWWSIGRTAPAHASARVGHYKSGELPAYLMPRRRFNQAKSFLLERLWIPSAVSGLHAYIEQQKPDLLWLQVNSWGVPVLHQAVRDLDLPWHMTVHDLLDTENSVRALGAKRAARFQRMVEDLYAGAASRDVYTQELGDEMERVTGRKAELVIHCGVEPEELDYVRATPLRPPRDKIRIGYPGTIIADDTFSRFIAALQMLRAKLPLPLEVNLFGIHSYRDRPWFDASLIVEHSYLPEDELDRRYRNCDWGLAVMDLDDSNPRYSRFSFPCKFTRPLAAGLPVICLGHSECTLIRFSKRFRLGPVITSPDPREIAGELLPALADFGESPGRHAEILRCAETEFNAELNRRRLHQLFDAARKKSPHRA